MRLKSCMNRDCTETTRRPRQYRSDAVRWCCYCRSKLQEFETVSSDTTSPKRERSRGKVNTNGVTGPEARPLSVSTEPGVDVFGKSTITTMRGGERGATISGSGSRGQGGRGVSILRDGGSACGSRVDRFAQLLADDTFKVHFGDRELKWCLICHWSTHNSSQCKGETIQRESLRAELYWKQYGRGTSIRHLRNQPVDTLGLMDMLVTHQEGLLDVEKSFSARDGLLQNILEDDVLMARLSPALGPDETSKDIYERQIRMANNATKIFVVSVVNYIFTTFNAAVLKKRVRVSGEGTPQFRTRTVAELLKFPWRFHLPRLAFRSLVDSLECAWSTYEDRMNDLEAVLLERRYPGRVLSRGIQRIVRLPTSYFRMQVLREIKGEVLCLPLFVPFDEVLKPAVYTSDDIEFELDYLCRVGQEAGEPTGMYDSKLTKISLPAAFQALDLGIGAMSEMGDGSGSDHCGNGW